MNLQSFALERYFSKHEFASKFLLSSSDCDGLPMQEVLRMATPELLEQWNKLTLGYTESAGLPALRSAIASLYDSISPDEVLVLSPGEANFILMNVLLKKGDHVICMTPAYQSLYEVAQSVGAEISFWAPREDNGSWSYDPDDLTKLVRSNTMLLILNFPHNPTGWSPSEQQFQHILQLAASHNIRVFSDEMYRELYDDEAMRLPSASDIDRNAISLWGMAKTFGCAGLRIGWVVSHDHELLHKIQSYKDYLTICNSAPSEVLSLIVLQNHRQIIENNRDVIKTNRRVFSLFCQNHHGITDYPSHSGSTGFAAIATASTLEFCDRLVESTGVMAVPSEMFGFRPGFIRLGFGRRNFPDALTGLSKFLTRSKLKN